MLIYFQQFVYAFALISTYPNGTIDFLLCSLDKIGLGYFK